MTYGLQAFFIVDHLLLAGRSTRRHVPPLLATARTKGCRGAHPEEERECEEFHHGEVEVVCVAFCEEVMGWEPCM